MKKLIPVVAATALGLAGCANTPSNNAADNDTLQVMASFYPLQFVAEQVGGEHVTVTSMTPAGGEAHDLELSPKTVAQMEQADVIVYLHGFQPAVDAAIAEADLAHIYDAKADANLIAIGGGDGSDDHDHEGDAHDEHDHEGEAHDDHDHEGDAHDDHDHEGEAHDEHDHEGEAHDDHDHEGEAHDEHDTQHHHHDLGGLDPHFWLDPMRVDHVAQQLAETFASADSAHAQDYRANARELTTKLADLHDDYHTGLAQCSGDTIVVSHEAYGYITAEYGLRQVGLSGVDPEAEPAPATLAKVKAVMDKYNVTTIFTENLIDSRAAEAFAAETGAKTAVLDPIENLADTDKDYLVLMEENLQELRKALQCR